MKKSLCFSLFLIIFQCFVMAQTIFSQSNQFYSPSTQWLNQIPIEQVRSKVDFQNRIARYGYRAVFEDIQVNDQSELNKVRILKVDDQVRIIYATFGARYVPSGSSAGYSPNIAWLNGVNLDKVLGRQELLGRAKSYGWNVIFQEIRATDPALFDKFKLARADNYTRTVYFQHYSSYAVPNLVGQKESIALDLFKNSSIKLEIQNLVDTNINKYGLIASQSLSPGYVIKSKDVTVQTPQQKSSNPFQKTELIRNSSYNTYSSYSSPMSSTQQVLQLKVYRIPAAKMPDIKGLTLEEARKKISSVQAPIGYIQELFEPTKNTASVGKIFEQTIPPGTVLTAPKMMGVKIYSFSDVKMPDLTKGWTLEKAKAEPYLNITTTFIGTGDQSKDSMIFEQSVKANTALYKKTDVNIKVFKYIGKVIVPDLRKLTYTEAQKKLSELGLKSKIIEKDIQEYLKMFGFRSEIKFDSDIRNTVEHQNIDKGSQVEYGSEIQLTVLIPKSIIMPDLKGLSCSQAYTKNREIGDKIGNIYYSIKNEPVSPPLIDNTIIRTVPAAGQKITTLDNFTVYCGRTVPLIPNVVGMTEQEAEKKLKESGLTVSEKGKNPHPNFKTGQVYATFPFAGEAIKPDTKISLSITDNESAVLPYLIGKSPEEAIKTLKASGYNSYLVEYVYYDKVNDKNAYMLKKDSIDKVESVDPNKFLQIVPTNTRIILKVAKWLDEKPIKVPDIQFHKESTAKTKLEMEGLIPKITYLVTTATELDKQVVSKSINPAIGTEVKKGSEVSFSVYSLQSKVPFVAWFDEKDAVEIIERSSLKVEKLYKTTDNKANEGKVAEQSPEKYTMLNPGSTVKITIWKYSGMVTVPNLVNQELNDAVKNYLNENNLAYKIEYKDTVLTSQVNSKIFKTEPAYKASVIEGSTVKVYFYKLLEKVPNVIGKNEEEAVKLLEELGFGVKKEYSDKYDPGIVGYQSQKPYASSPYAHMTIHIGQPQIPKPMASMQSLLLTIDDKQKVEDFYKKFKDAYEMQDEYRIINMISNDWTSSDGASIADIEDNFRKIFSVFDSIQYDISGINITKQSNGTYLVNYEVSITGKIYDMGMTHKEKSSVNEILQMEGNSLKLLKTLNGNFWKIE